MSAESGISLEPEGLTEEPLEHAPRRHGLRRRHIALGLVVAFIAFVTWFVPPVYKLKHGPIVVTRYDKKFGETKATVGPTIKGWITTKQISRHFLHAVIAAEDGHFYEHHGLDWEAIRKAREYNEKKHRYARGASTLSQQVVKMAFLGREKTLTRKAREAVGTLLMEMILPKDKILEWYINLAEFGDGVYGIREGCWHYFKTKPELLTIEQSIHLALVLPSPNAWSRGLRKRSLTPFGHRRYAVILNTMRGMGYVTKTQWLTAVTRGDFGRPIHGYAELVAAEESHKALCPGSPGCPEGEEALDTGDEDGEETMDLTPDAPAPAKAPTGTATSTGKALGTGTAGTTGRAGVAGPSGAAGTASPATSEPPHTTGPVLPNAPADTPPDDDAPAGDGADGA